MTSTYTLTDFKRCTAIQCPEIQSNDPNLQIWNQDRNFSSTASFSCPDGFNLQGAASVTCNSTGSWSNPVPYCEGQCGYAACCQCVCVLRHLYSVWYLHLCVHSPISEREGRKLFAIPLYEFFLPFSLLSAHLILSFCYGINSAISSKMLRLQQRRKQEL